MPGRPLDPRLAIGFCAVVEGGSITAGAKQLGLAQPWMSEQIMKLERQLGAPLLLRSTRQMCLTDLGREFLPYAQAVRTAIAQAEHFAAAERARAELQIKVGATNFTIGMPERRRLIDMLLQFHPLAQPEIHPDDTARLVAKVLEGTLDVAIVHRNGVLDVPQLENVLIGERFAHVLMPEDDVLSSHAPLEIEQLAGRELVVSSGREDGVSMHRSLAALEDVGVRLVTAPDIDRRAVEAFAMRRSSLCLLWDIKKLIRHRRDNRLCVPFAGYPIKSSMALIRCRETEHRRPIRWLWTVAQQLEREIAASANDPPVFPSDGLATEGPAHHA